MMLSLTGLAASGDATVTRSAHRWPDTILARAEAQSLLEQLNASLLAAATATTFLDEWCAESKFAPDGKIRAQLVNGEETPVLKEQRQRLRIDAAEPVKYRRVRLVCGDHILSEAENWYVPGRLSAQMNDALARTDMPFGRVVRDLKPFRKTFSVEIFWRPLAAGEAQRAKTPDRPDAELNIPERLFEHRALVFNADQVPFSEVQETYMSTLLAFAP